RAELHFALENGVGSAIVHDQKDEISGLAADLKSDAAAFQGHHRRSAPRAGEVLARAASHGATAIAATDNESGFQDGRVHDHAFGFVEQILRDVVGNIENFFEDESAVFQAVCFLLV